MRFKILIFLCLVVLLAISAPIISAQTQYKIYFNHIVCLNNWNVGTLEKGLEFSYPIHAEFVNAAAGKAPNPEQVKLNRPSSEMDNISYLRSLAKGFAEDGKAETKYFPNMSLANFPHNLFAAARLKLNREMIQGEANASTNDRFYITYKNTARQGMVLPVKGGDKDMFTYEDWKPTPADGNPALAGQDNITYYLWEADVISKDNSIGQFSINLKDKKDKGPQMVEVVKGLFKAINFGGDGSYGSSVYVIEYEVK